MNRPCGLFLIAIAFSALIGCQGEDKPKYANVSGTVTFDGQPVSKGEITFSVEGRPPTTMNIVGGKFNGQAMIGSNKISVSAKKKGNAPKLSADAQAQVAGYTEKMKSGGGMGQPPADYDPTMIEYIPADWSQASKQIRVVEAGATNEFKLDITSK